MRALISFFIFISAIIAGCSSNSSTPMSSGFDEFMPIPTSSLSSDQTQVLVSGVMDLSTGTIEFDSRNVDPYCNVTGILGTNFSYRINSLIPPDTWDITLTINNVSTITTYDVVIVFERLYGKKVLNNDGRIDIYQPFDMDPIIAFRKEDPNRAFPAGTDTKQLILQYPSGAGALINFMILAHFPGNAGGVYDLYDWTQVGELTNDQGLTTLSVRASDWQNDVTAVYVDTRLFTGEISQMTKRYDGAWTISIQNTEEASPDTYNVIVMAFSPSDPSYNYYEVFPVTVEFGVSIFGDDIDISDDSVSSFSLRYCRRSAAVRMFWSAPMR